MRKKLDPRIRALMANARKARHRGLFVIIGDRARDQVVNLFNLWLSIKNDDDSENSAVKPNVLWCYEKQLGFSTHQHKKKKMISRMMREGVYEKETEN